MNNNLQYNSHKIDHKAVTGALLKLFKKYLVAFVIAAILLSLPNLINRIFFKSSPYVFISGFIYRPVIYSIFIYYIDRNEHKHKEGILTIIKQVSIRFIPAIIVDFVTSIIFLFGLILLIVPGIIWVTMFSMAFNLTVLDKIGVKKALVSSKEMTKGKLNAIATVYGRALGPIPILHLGINFLLRPYPYVNSIYSSIITPFIGMFVVLISYELWRVLSNLQNKS